MFVDRHDPEDIFARVPKVAAQYDPVLKELDALLEDDELFRQVKVDLGTRYRKTPGASRHAVMYLPLKGEGT